MLQAVAGGAVIRAARPGDLPAVLALLQAAKLPGAGVAEWLARFLVVEAGGALVGVAGLERHGPDGLLRSVAVAPDWRGRGLGAALTQALLARAEEERLRAVYLLTETAASYFPRLGFQQITREQASPEVRESSEFRELCPVSSVVMVKPLGDPPR